MTRLLSPLGWVVLATMIFWLLILGWFTGWAWGAPFLVCNPQAGVNYYTISGDPFWTANITAQTDGSLKSDVAGIPNGNHVISVVACSELWGCSTSTPFSFSSAKPLSPAALIITK